jgi:hypothetical protein
VQVYGSLMASRGHNGATWEAAAASTTQRAADKAALKPTRMAEGWHGSENNEDQEGQLVKTHKGR